MNIKRLLLVVWICIHAGSVLAQNYSIVWSTIDGGSSTSTGAVYSVSGTIGQSDAGNLTGGGYTLAGGFWGILSVVQTPGAPSLSIRFTPTNTVVVSWPSDSADLALQQCSSLESADWIAPTETVSDNGTNKFIIVNPPTGNRFFRLFKP